MKPFQTLLTMLLLASQTLWAAPGKLQNSDFKTPAQLSAAGAPLSQLLNDSKIWVTANGINQQLSSAIQSGLIGGGAGQNLVSNGSFEASGVAGWSTFQTTLAAAPSLAPTTAPAACTSCTFAIGAQTSGALDGATSLQLTGASTTTAGQGFISSAFTVAPVYRGQVMSIKGAFGVVSGLAALNLSGTSSNSFAIYIYDVTNATWIQPNGTYGMASNGGLFGPISFQVPFNTTQLQLAIVNVNAITGATVQLFDDLVVGPATSAFGLAGTDEVVTTPIVTNTSGTQVKPTTMVQDKLAWSRVGDKMHLSFTQSWANQSGGSNGTGCQLIQVPPPFQIDMNKSKIASGGTAGYNNGYGTARFYDNVNNGVGSVGVYSPTQLIVLGKFNSNGAQGSVTDLCWGASFGYGDTSVPVTITFDVWLPIVGWSTNVTQSADFDGRNVSFSGYTSAGQSIAANAVIPVATVKDAAGAWSGTTYTVQTAGDYSVTGTFISNTASTGYASLNGAAGGTVGGQYWSNIVQANGVSSGTSFFPNLKVGDQLSMRVNIAGSISNASFAVARVPGSSPIIQASQAISATVGLVAQQSVAANSAVKYDYKFDDSASIYSTITGFFTAPTAGKYRVSITGVGDTTRNYVLYKNVGGTITRDKTLMGPAANTTAAATQSIRLNANEGVAVYLDGAANLFGGTAPALSNTCTFERTGN